MKKDESFEPRPSSNAEADDQLRRPMLYPVELRPPRTDDIPGTAREGKGVVAALFVATGGVYFGLDGVDPWDEARDARLYAGPHPVVAHPPCSRWCQLARVVEARYGHKVGDDDGCFEAALDAVREFGGVLEHPAETIAWKWFDLGRPPTGRWARSYRGEWSTEVWQRAYGHPARKRTWIFYVGESSPPELDWSQPPPVACVSYMRNHRPPALPRLTKKQAKATPPAFRDLLLSIARSARPSDADRCEQAFLAACAKERR